MNQEALAKKLNNWRKRFDLGQWCWSFAHHFCLFGSIICSISAGTLLQINKDSLTTTAAVLTSCAAVLTGIAVSGGFDRKWHSNRLSRSRVDVLLLRLEADNPDLEAIRECLEDVIAKHDNEIVSKRSNS